MFSKPITLWLLNCINKTIHVTKSRKYFPLAGRMRPANRMLANPELDSLHSHNATRYSNPQ
jgi:hypothetical protein